VPAALPMNCSPIGALGEQIPAFALGAAEAEVQMAGMRRAEGGGGVPRLGQRGAVGDRLGIVVGAVALRLRRGGPEVGSGLIPAAP
jgi:hypothetical protein